MWSNHCQRNEEWYTCCPNVSLDTCGPNCVDKTTITVSHRHSSCLSICLFMLGCLSLSTCCLNSVIDRQINTSFIHSFIVVLCVWNKLHNNSQYSEAGLHDDSYFKRDHHFCFSQFIEHNGLQYFPVGYFSWMRFICCLHYIALVKSLHKGSWLPDVNSLNPPIRAFFSLNVYIFHPEVYLIFPNWQPCIHYRKSLDELKTLANMQVGV